MAGTNILTSTLDLVSQSLQIPVIIFQIPVIIFLLIFAIGAIILLGGLIREFRHRKTVSNVEMKTLINSISNAKSQDEILNIIESSDIPNSMKNDLMEITDTDLDLESRIALAKKLVNSREKKLEKRLSYTDIITRIGPTLGLMGTLIPMDHSRIRHHSRRDRIRSPCICHKQNQTKMVQRIHSQHRRIE